MFGVIHGILLTAWSVAAGLVLIPEYNVTHGVPKAQAYNVTMYIMGGLFVIGFIANFCIKAVDKRHHMVKDVSVKGLEPDATGATASVAAVPGRA